MLSKEEKVSVLSESRRMVLAEKAVEAIIEQSRRKKELCVELAEIENDPVRQLLRVYTRGTNHEEFWALVERLRAFSEGGGTGGSPY